MVEQRSKAFTDRASNNDALASLVGSRCDASRACALDRASNHYPHHRCSPVWYVLRRTWTCTYGYDDPNGCASRVKSISQKVTKGFSFRKCIHRITGSMWNTCSWLGRMALCFGVCLSLILAYPAAVKADAACSNYDIFARIIDDVCWDCMFPIVISGIGMGGGSRPPGSATPSTVCQCDTGNGLQAGFGFGFSMWEPARLVEVVRRPYCFPSLGGSVLDPGGNSTPGSNGLMMGGKSSESNENDSSDKVFYNYHYFAFPLTVILNLFSGCSPDGYMAFDLMYISELDPTWNDDELAFLTNPEVVMVANPVSQAACIADATASTAGFPLDTMFWCAGTWGSLYPFTGNILTNVSQPRDTSLIAARALAALHRRGLAWKTMGDAAMCGGYIYPSLPKTQYKFEQMYPLAESNSNHWIGESPFIWGEWRNEPGVAEDYIHMIWRWKDCCIPFF